MCDPVCIEDDTMENEEYYDKKCSIEKIRMKEQIQDKSHNDDDTCSFFYDIRESLDPSLLARWEDRDTFPGSDLFEIIPIQCHEDREIFPVDIISDLVVEIGPIRHPEEPRYYEVNDRKNTIGYQEWLYPLCISESIESDWFSEEHDRGKSKKCPTSKLQNSEEYEHPCSVKWFEKFLYFLREDHRREKRKSSHVLHEKMVYGESIRFEPLYDWMAAPLRIELRFSALETDVLTAVRQGYIDPKVNSSYLYFERNQVLDFSLFGSEN